MPIIVIIEKAEISTCKPKGITYDKSNDKVGQWFIFIINKHLFLLLLR